MRETPICFVMTVRLSVHMFACISAGPIRPITVKILFWGLLWKSFGTIEICLERDKNIWQSYEDLKGKIKSTLELVTKAHSGSRVAALLFF